MINENNFKSLVLEINHRNNKKDIDSLDKEISETVTEKKQIEEELVYFKKEIKDAEELIEKYKKQDPDSFDEIDLETIEYLKKDIIRYQAFINLNTAFFQDLEKIQETQTKLKKDLIVQTKRIEDALFSKIKKTNA